MFAVISRGLLLASIAASMPLSAHFHDEALLHFQSQDFNSSEEHSIIHWNFQLG
jgi:hypothetical protein